MSKGDTNDDAGKGSEREIIRQAVLQVEEMNKRIKPTLDSLAERKDRKGLHPLLVELEESIKQRLRESLRKS